MGFTGLGPTLQVVRSMSTSLTGRMVIGGTTEISGHEGSSVHGTTFRKKLTTLRVLKWNSYSANFICNDSVPPTQEITDTHSCDGGQEEDKVKDTLPLGKQCAADEAWWYCILHSG